MPEIIEVQELGLLKGDRQTVLRCENDRDEAWFWEDACCGYFKTNRERHGLWSLVANAQKEQKDQVVVLLDIFSSVQREKREKI